jgi:hypothetical protein
MGKTHPSLEEPRWIIYTYQRGSIQGLACRPIILPSHKISPWSSQSSPMEILRKIGRKNRKTKWSRVPRDDCHPLTTWVIWRQPKD